MVMYSLLRQSNSVWHLLFLITIVVLYIWSMSNFSRGGFEKGPQGITRGEGKHCPAKSRFSSLAWLTLLLEMRETSTGNILVYAEYLSAQAMDILRQCFGVTLTLPSSNFPLASRVCWQDHEEREQFKGSGRFIVVCVWIAWGKIFDRYSYI